MLPGPCLHRSASHLQIKRPCIDTKHSEQVTRLTASLDAAAEKQAALEEELAERGRALAAEKQCTQAQAEEIVALKTEREANMAEIGRLESVEGRERLLASNFRKAI